MNDINDTDNQANNNTVSEIQDNLTKNLYYIAIRGLPMISLLIDGKERVCLSQISNTLLKRYSYNEIHNRRVALGINCVQCTPFQLDLLRNAGAMPVSSRRCGMITSREAERLVNSFLDENKPLSLPDNFSFDVQHKCGFGCRGIFYPSRYNSSRAKCIRCFYCTLFFSPNKFVFHMHETSNSKFNKSETGNFNSWRRHITLLNEFNDDTVINAWEDVKSIFNGGKRKRGQNSPISSDNESDFESAINDSLQQSNSTESEIVVDDKNTKNEINSDNLQLNSSIFQPQLQFSLNNIFTPSYAPRQAFNFAYLLPEFLGLMQHLHKNYEESNKIINQENLFKQTASNNFKVNNESMSNDLKSNEMNKRANSINSENNVILSKNCNENEFDHSQTKKSLNLFENDQNLIESHSSKLKDKDLDYDNSSINKSAFKPIEKKPKIFSIVDKIK